MQGEILSLERPTRLVYTWEWDDNGEVTQIDVQFKGHNEGVEVELSHSGFQSEESRAMHDSGWDSYVEGVVRKLQDD